MMDKARGNTPMFNHISKLAATKHRQCEHIFSAIPEPCDTKMNFNESWKLENMLKTITLLFCMADVPFIGLQYQLSLILSALLSILEATLSADGLVLAKRSSKIRTRNSIRS